MVFSFTSTAGTADEFGAAMADPRSRVDLHDARYTTSTDMTGGSRRRGIFGKRSQFSGVSCQNSGQASTNRALHRPTSGSRISAEIPLRIGFLAPRLRPGRQCCRPVKACPDDTERGP